MAEGKFSKPRPYRDEEREIEQAFRQITGQAPPPEPDPIPGDLGPLPDHPPEALPADLISEEFPELEAEILAQEGKYLEEEAPPEPDFIDKLQSFLRRGADFCSKNPRPVMAAVCAVALVIILGFMAAILFSGSDPYGGKILNNVYLAGVNVGGMTKSEAVTAVKQATDRTYPQQDMVVDLAGTPLYLKPKDTKVSLDVKAAVNAAFNYGRTGSREEREQNYLASQSGNHFIGLLPYLSLDQSYIRQVLTAYARDTGSTLTQTRYGLEGTMPQLAADKFSENAPCQTLVFTMGTPGIGFDPEAVLDQVLDAYSLNLFRVEVEDIRSEAEPDPIDLEAVYEELYIAPVNASINMQTFEVIPGSYGYGFDLEQAQALLDSAGYGEEVRIPMEYIAPEIADEDVFFRDVLGAFETPHSKNDDRTNNLKLACEALDGLVLNPGETFSYNDTLGKRTESKGYRPAPSYVGLETVDTVGGGICQVSSTLYYCTLLADLSVTERTNHGFVPSYIDYGMDATVSWGGPDFKFKNSTNYPIRIEAEVSGGYVKVQILGTDEKDYYVKMEYEITDTYKPKTEYEDFPFDNDEGYEDGDVIEEGKTGYRVKTYKLKYDKETDQLKSRDFEANSRYTTVDKVVARVEPEKTEPPTTEETVPPTTEETTPPTTEETVPPTTEETAPPTTETTEPPTTEATQPPTTEATEPPTTAPTEPPTSPSTEPPVTPEAPAEGGEGGDTVVDPPVENPPAEDPPVEENSAA